MTYPFFLILRKVLHIAWIVMLMVLTWISMLHLKPYGHPSGFKVLVPDVTCNPPCVLGIQPGLTTSAEAAHLLNAHPMVNSLRHDVHEDESGEIWWNWQPEYADLKPIGVNVLWHEDDNVIAGASIPTTVPLFEYRLLLGAPEAVQVTRYPSSGDVIVRESHKGMYLTYSYRCLPNSTPRPYKQPVTILINPDNRSFQFEGSTSNRHVLYANPCQPKS